MKIKLLVLDEINNTLYEQEAYVDETDLKLVHNRKEVMAMKVEEAAKKIAHTIANAS